MSSLEQAIQSSKIGFRETLENSKTIFIRNLLIFKRGWFYFFGSVIFETLIYFYAFAILLAELVNIENFSYTQFFIPSILALIGLQTAFVESAWNSLKRFGSKKSLLIYLSTQLRVDDIFTGELFWALTKSVLASVLSLAILMALNVFQVNYFLFLFLVIVLNCWCFSALSLLLLSFSRSEMTFTKHHIFVMLPVVVFSNIFFPFNIMPNFVQGIAYLSPLTHVTECIRILQQGLLNQQFYIHLSLLFFMCLFLTYLAHSAIKKRVLTDLYKDSSSE